MLYNISIPPRSIDSITQRRLPLGSLRILTLYKHDIINWHICDFAFFFNFTAV